MKTSALGIVLLSLWIVGCTSVSSRQQPFVATGKVDSAAKPALTDGVTYWMPKRDIVVSVTMDDEKSKPEATGAADAPTEPSGKKNAVAKASQALLAGARGKGKPGNDSPAQGKPAEGQPAEKPQEKPADEPAERPAEKPAEEPASNDPEAPTVPVIKIGVSPSYADESVAYVARFSRNFIGKNDLTIEVSDRGLLTSSKTVTTSQLSDILTSLAGSAGSVRAILSSEEPEQPEQCPEKVSFVFRVDMTRAMAGYNIPVPGSKTCNVFVVVRPPNLNVASNARTRHPEMRHSGYFYKQNLPYEVTVKFQHWEAMDRVMLPNDSPVQFVPLDRGLFASNTSELTFSDGVLKKYSQSMDGEILALAKLPADVLKAYFTAIGSMFTTRKTSATEQSAYLDEMLKLKAKQAATDRCLAAYRADDAALIQADCP
jgi:hypothetical protein